MAEKEQVHHLENLQKDKDDPRNAKAKEMGVTGAFAVFRDGAVWEFAQEAPMTEAPTELVNTFGGSTGLGSAATSLPAVVKFKRRTAQGKSKKCDITLPTHDINGRLAQIMVDSGSRGSSPASSRGSPSFKRGSPKSSPTKSPRKRGSGLRQVDKDAAK